MRKLLKYLSEYKKESILSPLFKMLEASFELFVPLVIASMVDTGIGDRAFLIKCFFLLILLGFIGLICSCTAQFFAAKAATGFSTGLRHDLFKHLLNISYSNIDNMGTSTMITRMSADVNTVQNGVNMFLRLFLRSPFIVVGAMIMAFTIDVKAALVFLFVIIFLGIVVGIIMSMNIPMLKKVQSALDDVLRLTRENLSGVRVIRAFTREKEEVNIFSNSNDALTKKQKGAGAISGLLNPFTYIIINIAIVLLIKICGIRVTAGELSTGEVVALYNYMSQILLELIKFAGLVITINKALASANRISDVFEIPVGMPGGKQISDAFNGKGAVIEFDDVSLRYHDEADTSLENISFKIDAGSTLGVIGGTGSGKTSLVNLIPRFYDATTGNVLVNGVNVKDIDIKELRGHIGIVPQKAVLFNGTIAENLRWGNEDATLEDLEDAVEKAVAKDVVSSKGGFEALIEAGGKNLSGGQRQRLTIARALVKRPEILILDDSSSALDYLTDSKLRRNLKESGFDSTVIIVSQRTSAVADADKILVLDDGQMVGFGTQKELLDSCEVYREIYYSQTGKEAE